MIRTTAEDDQRERGMRRENEPPANQRSYCAPSELDVSSSVQRVFDRACGVRRCGAAPRYFEKCAAGEEKMRGVFSWLREERVLLTIFYAVYSAVKSRETHSSLCNRLYGS